MMSQSKQLGTTGEFDLCGRVWHGMSSWGDYPLPSLVVCPIYKDGRGSFTVLGAGGPTKQTNLSVSNFNVIRGMHWQIGEHAIAKYVRCIGGKILDVVVDMRPGSKTWGLWQGFVLVGGASNMTEIQEGLVVPKGFAHGFQVLSVNATVLYEQDGLWSPQNERTINPLDPELGIQWKESTVSPTLSEKDKDSPGLAVFK